MVKSHPDRYGDAFWKFFETEVVPHLPPRPTVIDLGCGPGLFLHDLARRHRDATLHGYDVTPAMIDHARRLPATGAALTFTVLDVAGQPLPHGAGTVDLVCMSSVLHVVDEPWPVLAEIRRVLAPRGLFVLHDWVRQPLSTYLAWRRDALGESEAESRRRGFRLFPAHAKYTADDWRWLLGQAGFAIRHEAHLRASHRVFVTTPSAEARVG
jgi:SAM-dependent methyltransferase